MSLRTVCKSGILLLKLIHGFIKHVWRPSVPGVFYVVMCDNKSNETP